MIKFILAPAIGIVLLVPVLYLTFASETLNSDQFFVIKLVASLAAAGVASVIPGFVRLDLPVGQMLIRAGGAVAIFLIVWFTAPKQNGDDGPTPEPSPGLQKEMEGFLGDFRKSIAEHVSIDEFSLDFSEADAGSLEDFFVYPPVGGNTYGEVMQKICALNPCLQCIPAPSSESIRVEVDIKDGPLGETRDSVNLERKKLICPK